MALGIFFVFVLVLVPHTLFNNTRNLLEVPIRVLLVCLALNLLLCTINRFRALRKGTLAIHIGMLITLGGAFVSSFGYIATVNVHERDATATVFRWDRQQDISLGFDLAVQEITRTYYPAMLKIGVVHEGRKAALNIVREKEGFAWQRFMVVPDNFDPGKQSLRFRVHDENGSLVENCLTLEECSLPGAGKVSFQLVAYKDPVLKNFGAVLKISQNGRELASGHSTINHPFQWQGLNFFITQIAADQYGFPYAGIQIVRDPGIYFVYVGFLVICLGCLLHLKRYFIRSGS